MSLFILCVYLYGLFVPAIIDIIIVFVIVTKELIRLPGSLMSNYFGLIVYTFEVVLELAYSL